MRSKDGEKRGRRGEQIGVALARGFSPQARAEQRQRDLLLVTQQLLSEQQETNRLLRELLNLTQKEGA